MICDGTHVLKIVLLVQIFAVYSYVNADAICVVGHQLGLFDANFHANGRTGLIQAISERSYSRISSSFPAKPSISSAKHKLAIVLPPMLTVPL